MTKPHAKSTMKEMKDYIRKNKLNKAEVKLTMRKPEMVKALKKMGHWDTKNDETKKKPAKKKKLSNYMSSNRITKKFDELLAINKTPEEKRNIHEKQQDMIKSVLPKNYKGFSWAVPMVWKKLNDLPSNYYSTIYQNY